MKKKYYNCPITIYELIATYYYEFKQIADRECRKFGCTYLDEDIFHNVLLSMADRFGLSNYLLTLKQAKGYFCNAFKNALCRETLYARNKYKSGDEFVECIFKTKDGDLDEKIDYSAIMLDIEKNYKEEESFLFYDYIKGFTLKELNQKYKIGNSDYIVRKIKSYIKKEYPEFDIKRKKR